MLNDQTAKLCNNSKVPNQTNQIQTQIMMERGNPLLEPTQGSRQVEEKRPVVRRSKHVLFMKKLLNMIERGNMLLTQEQPKHVHLMTARVSTVKIKRHMIERGNPLKAVTQIMCQTVLKHVPLMQAQASTLEMKQFMIERVNPL